MTGYPNPTEATSKRRKRPRSPFRCDEVGLAEVSRDFLLFHNPERRNDMSDEKRSLTFKFADETASRCTLDDCVARSQVAVTVQEGHDVTTERVCGPHLVAMLAAAAVEMAREGVS